MCSSKAAVWLGLLLQRQQLLFAFDAPAIASQIAVFANDAMAGNGYSYGVGGAGASDGAGRFGHADFFGDGAVGASFSAGDLLQRLPDTALKGGGADVEGQRGVDLFSLQQAGQGVSPGGHGFVVAAANGERKLAHEALLQLALGVAELDGANTFVGSSDEHESQRRTGEMAAKDGVADDGGDGAAAVFLRGHAELRGGAFVEAAAGAVSGGVEGGGDVVAGLQVVLDLAEADGIDVGLGGNSEEGLEGALQVERAAVELAGEALEGERLVDVLLDVTAEGAHERGLGIAVDGFGAATEAGAIA